MAADAKASPSASVSRQELGAEAQTLLTHGNMQNARLESHLKDSQAAGGKVNKKAVIIFFLMLPFQQDTK